MNEQILIAIPEEVYLNWIELLKQELTEEIKSTISEEMKEYLHS